MSSRYIGGPFDGGSNPDSFIDEIVMRSPSGTGRYVQDTDQDGATVYRWEPEEEAAR
ncbi:MULTISPECIES: hypothetical protein [unclassified Streptomyces]|uniref:hypothetical protein n=1 Tax=unclassified Streptomyces TaxID=2593676 RepID=UPI003318D472